MFVNNNARAALILYIFIWLFIIYFILKTSHLQQKHFIPFLILILKEKRRHRFFNKVLGHFLSNQSRYCIKFRGYQSSRFLRFLREIKYQQKFLQLKLLLISVKTHQNIREKHKNIKNREIKYLGNIII